MKTKHKKAICFLQASVLALGLGFGMAGCGESGSGGDDTPKTYSDVIPTYAALTDPTTQGFYTSLFGDPYQQTVEAYKTIKDCGFRYVQLDPWFGTALDSPGLISALEACEANDLKAIIMINNNHEEGWVPFSFEEATLDYTQYAAFEGFYSFDEPNRSQFDWIANDLTKWQNSKYKDYTYMLTMMSGDGTSDRDTFLSEYCEKVLKNNKDKILQYDKYPLWADISDKTMPYIEKDTLGVLEDMARYAKKYEAELYAFLQTTEYSNGAARAMESAHDVRFQVAMYLAYGAKGFPCFTYVSMPNAGFGDAMIEADGTIYPTYYYVQEVFQELFDWEHVYMDFEWNGTMTLLGQNRSQYGSQNENHITSLAFSLEEHDRIKKIKNENDLLVGTFEDSKGYDGFLITSYTDPYYKKSNEIEIEFNETSKALIYHNGQLVTTDEAETYYALQDGKLVWELETGDYLFVIPVK